VQYFFHASSSLVQIAPLFEGQIRSAWAEMLDRPMVVLSTAVCFKIFNFDLEFFKV
jgi:hypothetical protein